MEDFVCVGKFRECSIDFCFTEERNRNLDFFGRRKVFKAFLFIGFG